MQKLGPCLLVTCHTQVVLKSMPKNEVNETPWKQQGNDVVF